MPETPIVITGLGAASALGLGVDANVSSALEGRPGIRSHTFEPGPNGPAPHTVPAALVEADVAGALQALLGRRIGGALDDFAILALWAAREALDQAGLIGAPALETRCAAVFGHGFAGIHTLEANYERFYGRRTPKVHPLTVPKVMVSAPASAISIEFGLRGPVFAVSSACASSAHAVIQGADLIAAGRVDMALVGGSEAIATPACLRAWDALGAMSDNACRPFSAGRDGMTIGEGAAALLLEREDHARARGAPILGRLLGTGMSSDASHWTQPSLDGALACMREACESAGVLDGREILISTHGTGTPLNDKNEAAAIHALFKDRAKTHPVIATKSGHGHLIGASAALQAVIGLEAMRTGKAPPILNFLERRSRVRPRPGPRRSATRSPPRPCCSTPSPSAVSTRAW